LHEPGTCQGWGYPKPQADPARLTAPGWGERWARGSHLAMCSAWGCVLLLLSAGKTQGEPATLAGSNR